MRNDYLIRKTILLYLIPSVGMVLSATIGMSVDGIVTANILGHTALQALNLATPCFLIITSFSSIIGMGGCILVGFAFGKNDQKEANDIFSMSCIISLVIGAFLMAIGYGFLDQIVSVLGGTGEIGTLLRQYLQGLLLIALPAAFLQIFTNFASVDSDPGIAAISILVLTAVNITLDIWFTRVLHMGMFGMGLATSIAYLAATLVSAVHFFKKINSFRLTCPAFSQFRKIPNLLWTGLPTAANNLSSCVQITTFNLLLISISVAGALTAYAIFNNLLNLVFGIIAGVGLCIGPMVSVFFGENDRESMHIALRNALKVGLLLAFIVAITLFVFAKQIAGIFGVFDGSSLTESIAAIRWLAVGYPLTMINVVLGAFYQNTSQTTPSILVALGRNCLFLVIWIPLSIAWLGSYTVWVNLFISEIATYLLLAIIFGVKNKKFSLVPLKMIYLPPALKSEKILDISIQNNFTEITKIAKKLQEFAKEHNMEPRMGYCIALSIEEMARNVVQYGFRDKKTHFIDVRLIWNTEDKTCCIRLRDNGIMFNPLMRKEQNTVSDPFANIGIRMISNMVESIDYRYCVGMNNLIIKI